MAACCMSVKRSIMGRATCSCGFLLLMLLANVARAGQVISDVETIDLPGVSGRIDHMAVDVKNKRLFVAALGNNTVEVIDLALHRVIKSIAGFDEPQGLLLIPDLHKLFVTNGGTKFVHVYDSETLALREQIELREDGDNIRFDLLTQRAYIGCGSGKDAALVAIDVRSNGRLTDIALSGHPESFALERNGKRIFVNVPTSGAIEVIDRKLGRVIASWPLSEQKNFPMALDEDHHRLFVGTRKPAKLLVFDTETGRMVANLASVGDVDDIYYVPGTQRLYVSGGEGFLDVFQQHDNDRYSLLAKVATSTGARTSIYVPEWQQLFIAAPSIGTVPARIRVLHVGNP